MNKAILSCKSLSMFKYLFYNAKDTNNNSLQKYIAKNENQN